MIYRDGVIIEEVELENDTLDEWYDRCAKVRTTNQLARGYQDGAKKAQRGNLDWDSEFNTDYVKGVKLAFERYHALVGS